jgi:hypothetical protein
MVVQPRTRCNCCASEGFERAALVRDMLAGGEPIRWRVVSAVPAHAGGLGRCAAEGPTSCRPHPEQRRYLRLWWRSSGMRRRFALARAGTKRRGSGAGCAGRGRRHWHGGLAPAGAVQQANGWRPGGPGSDAMQRRCTSSRWPR